MKLIYLIAFFTIPLTVVAQRISNTALYRNVSSPKYFRINYENDYFSATDIYYTQGINLEQVHPKIKGFLTSKLLIRSGVSETKFGIALEHEGFTPTSISNSEILYGDRPFAACLFLKTFAMVNDSARKERLSSTFSAGVIGPAAGGKEMQESIHHWVNAKQPQGWQNQIQNDVILNYQVEYERGLITLGNNFSFSGKVGARAGSFSTKATAGSILMIGYFDNPFTNFLKQKKKTQIHLYAEPLLNLVVHDATLQGGLFNKTNPYTISSSDINRFVFQGNAGIVIKINAIQFEYFQSYLTKEFKTGDTHIWGGIRIGWYLKK
ncbi:MAG: lipid A deacylase LpxR family protein [Bacteroidetes bacterium]|nr:lipid A deacylase LpxR family protein [Bacteroidota bacterium]MBI3483174.1 lipid A deacylase LpxR family protein [Bacteroidota bacterium]